MKNQYVKPLLEVEGFTPNSYVAACGDSGTVYKFNCNIGSFVDLYIDTNKNGTLEKNVDRKVGTYNASGCGTKHETEMSSEFVDGFVTSYKWENRQYNEVVTPVIIWFKDGNQYNTKTSNVHVTKEIDKTKWETAKS